MAKSVYNGNKYDEENGSITLCTKMQVVYKNIQPQRNKIMRNPLGHGPKND